MPARLAGADRRYQRLWMPPADAPRYLELHRDTDKATPDIEAMGAALVVADFPPDDMPAFVQAVCKWGGYEGIAGRVLKHNSAEEVAAACRKGRQLSLGPDPGSAIEPIDDLKRLAISFASKHLKFLSPGNAVVLDSIISRRLGYPMTVLGYGDLLADCFSLLAEIENAGTPYPFPDGRWRVSDVEMAIFMKLRS
jgi:hypothetical protein